VKILVDRTRCDGNGVCVGIAPEVFDVDDNQYLRVAKPVPQDPEIKARVRVAVTSCPVLALKLAED
jgi:ferredoxin